MRNNVVFVLLMSLLGSTAIANPADICVSKPQAELIFTLDLVKTGILNPAAKTESDVYYLEQDLEIVKMFTAKLKPTFVNGKHVGFEANIGSLAGGSDYHCLDGVLSVSCDGSLKYQWPACNPEN